MPPSTVDRVARRLAASDLVRRLSDEMSPSDLRTLLLGIYERRARSRKPADVLREYETNRFFAPAPLPGRALADLERRALAGLPDTVEVLELSPLAPLGACSVLAPVHQNKVVSSVRGEVAADPTNVLALESALRRRAAGLQSRAAVHLATVQRIVRAQAMSGAQYFAHFAVLAQVSAARDRGNLAFESEALALQLASYCELVVAATEIEAGGLRVTYTPLGSERAAERVDEAFRAALPPGVAIALDGDRRSGRGYYRDVCFKLHAATSANERFELADGGAVDWTAQLLASKKERCVISGIGLDRLASLIAVPSRDPDRSAR